MISCFFVSIENVSYETKSISGIPLLLGSHLLLGKEMTLKTVKTVVIMTAVLDLAVAPFFPQYMGDRLSSSAFGGMFVGAGMALVFMRNLAAGGGDVLAKLLRIRYPYMQTGHAIMAIDLVIIAVSALAFKGIEAALYGLISMMCTTQTIDAILYGMNKGAMITIVPPKNQEIADQIMVRLNRGTVLMGKCRWKSGG